MTYHMIKVIVYIISVLVSMYGLSCFDFGRYLKKYKVREFYVFYCVASIALGYLFGSFILDFALNSFTL